jgi:solute carrier family 25 (mitochondrial uncoupling protein), member 8/9
MLKEFAISGASAAVATTLTNPLDVVKVRLQLHSGGGGQPTGMLGTGYALVKHEGSGALWKGVVPSVARGLFYGGLRLGLYTEIKEDMAPNDDASFGVKLAAGTMSGTIAAALSSPTELIKTRMQATSNQPQSMLDVVRTVLKQDGVRGLWRGAVPAMARSGILTATQCASYDEVKHRFIAASGWGNHVGTYFVCSMITGLITTTACNPPDVIKTHMFVGGGQQSAGVVDTTLAIWRTAGVRGFFKGWTPNYARLGPHTVITFVVNEELRELVGAKSL